METPALLRLAKELILIANAFGVVPATLSTHIVRKKHIFSENACKKDKSNAIKKETESKVLFKPTVIDIY